MKRTLIVLLFTLLISPASFAQTRKRSSSPKPKPAPAATQPVSAVRTNGANHVAEQIKLLAKFVYLVGGTTSTLTVQDEAIRRNEGGPNAAQRNEVARNQLRQSFAGFREGLDKLEIDFRATPELQPFYIKLAGVAAGAATAEQQAANNQFDAAAKSLLAVVGRLADVLVAMRM